MATTLTCDRCGKGGARPVQVSVGITGVVQVDQPTVHVADADICEACEALSLRVLFNQATKMLHEQVPYHRAIADAVARRDIAQSQLDALSPTLAQFADAGTPVPDEMAQERDNLLGQLSDA